MFPRPRISFRCAILLPAAALLAACSNVDPKSLQEGFKKYVNQQVEEAEAIADRFIAASPNAAEVDQAYYLRGIARMTRGNRAGAAADLRLAITKTTRADLRGKANRALGDIAYDQQQWADAFKSYQAALENPAADPVLVTYLNFRMGAILQAQGQWTNAPPWFAKVVAARNDAALADRAVRRMYATHFSVQYGAFQEAAGARTMAGQLQSSGITATVTTETRENKLWYLVQSGSYATMSEAALARDRVLPQFPVAVIVP